MDHAPNQPLGPIGFFLESTNYALIEGQTLEIPAMLVNLGATADAFVVTALGVPNNWLSLPTPAVILLERQASKQLIFKISPPVSTPSLAGNYALRVRIASQAKPEVFKELEISLNLQAPYTAPVEKAAPRLEAETARYTATPGMQLHIPVTLTNTAQQDQGFDLSQTGVPSSWVKFSPPVVQLKAGQKQAIEIAIQLPPAPETRAGKTSLVLRAVSQSDSSQRAELPIHLLVAAFQSQGSVGVLMNSVQFSVSPGSAISVPLTLVNQSLDDDQFTLAVEGIPTSWVSTSSPVTRLASGEQKEITISIRPPRAPQSKAGRHAFHVRVSRKLSMEDVVEVDCILTMATFTEFKTELLPTQIGSSDTAQMMVRNLGNVQTTFHITFQDPENALEFDVFHHADAQNEQQATNDMRTLMLNEQVPLRVGPGETKFLEFRAHLRSLQFFGGESVHPFSLIVQTSEKAPQKLNGQFRAQALIPLWALAAVFAVCMCLVCLIAGLLWQWNRPAPTPTIIVPNIQTQTIVAYTTSIASYVTQTAAARQTVESGNAETATALALTPTPTTTPTVTGTPTFTPTPSLTPPATDTPAPSTVAPTATFTYTPIPTTAIPSPTPTQPTATPSLPLLPGTIAFTSNRNGIRQIYEMSDPMLTNIKQVTFSAGDDLQSAWSPQGNHIAFTSSRDSNNEIYVMNVDGSNLINLTNSPANDQDPTWSLDGNWIAFTTDRDGNQEIYRMRADGTELTNLTQTPANDREPSWGREGNLFGATEVIVFTSERDGNLEIYRMNKDGQNQTNLSQNSASDFAPSASVKEEKIAFTSNRSGNDEIYVMGLNGNNPTNITNDTAIDQNPTWSPDGSWIAYTTNREGNIEIYIIRPNGTERYNLTRNPSEDLYPAWRTP
jgi:uncharacterized membrane protein